MNNDTKFLDLPTLVGDLFTQHDLQVDNLFATLWTNMHIPTLLHRAGFHKRSGIEVTHVIYLLLLWVWLKTESISMFSLQAMESFTEAKKDVMYDYLKADLMSAKLSAENEVRTTTKEFKEEQREQK